MNKGQDDCLRDQRLAVEGHDEVRVGVRQEVAQFVGVLSVENTEVDLVPLISLDRWRSLSLRLRDRLRKGLGNGGGM